VTFEVFHELVHDAGYLLVPGPDDTARGAPRQDGTAGVLLPERA